MPLIVYLEGNIGAGKTTLLRRLQCAYSHDDGLFMTEPVSEWKYLPLFYENPRKYAKDVQIEIMESLHRRETTCPPHDFYVLERSLNTSLNVFGAINCTHEEMADLSALYATLGYNNTFTPPARVVSLFIDTPAYKCHENIQKRNKPTDKNITLDYLATLGYRHRELFYRVDPDIHRISGDRPMDDLVVDAMNFINFLRETTPTTGLRRRISVPPQKKDEDDAVIVEDDV